MTLYIPMAAANGHPNSPSFLVPSSAPEAHMSQVIRTILRAKRIAVVCGAGISVDAGIPDFRSQDGLFQTLKRDNPKESLSSGKDLFDASVFKSKQKTDLFYRMIARLSLLSSQGQPTAFHQLLRVLDDRGQLLRVYTQNIDALEMKAGLSFGVPVFDEKNLRVKLKGKARVKAQESGSGAYSAKLGGRKGVKPFPKPVSNSEELESGVGPSTPSRRVTPTEENPHVNVIPRCIPLHGTLLTLYCQHCTQTFPLRAPSTSSHQTVLSPPSPPDSGDDLVTTTFLHSMLAHGTPPPCPSCESLEETRALVGKRLRGIGRLRPSVVLYGEEHREGEGVGEVVRRDLCGITDVKAPIPVRDKVESKTPNKSRVRTRKGPDLLLVVGTSLRVPGTKRIVREFSKAVRPPSGPQAPVQQISPMSSPPATEQIPSKIQTVYINFDFPLPTREWEGVFDVWVNGDVQAFAKAVDHAVKEEEKMDALKRERAPAAKAKTTGTPPKTPRQGRGKVGASAKAKSKRKADHPETPTRPAKRRKVNGHMPPTPTSLPRGRRARTMKPAFSSPRKIRKVTLRVPEVLLTRNLSFMHSHMAQSLSSLCSTLSPLSSPCPSPTIRKLKMPEDVDSWRRNVGESIDGEAENHSGLEEQSDEDVPLAFTLARRKLDSGILTPGSSPIK